MRRFFSRGRGPLATAGAAAAAITLALPLQAAACPTGADMRKGVLFTLVGGGAESHQSTRPDWVTIYADYGGGEGSLLEMYHGLYLYRDVPVLNGEFITSEEEVYGELGELTQWARPRPDAEWRNLTPSGGAAGAGPMQAYRLGACTYDAFEITLIFASDPGYFESYMYIPEFQTGLLVATEDITGAEVYRYNGVRVLE